MKKTFLLICFNLFAISVYMYVSFNKAKTQHHNEENCIKTSQKQTYKICNTLPYSEIKCGLPTTKTSPDGKEYVVPNRAFFIWFFKEEHEFKFFNYLALRSVASIQKPEEIVFYYSKTLPIGKHWERAVREIPCLKLEKIEEPAEVGGLQMPDAVRRSDTARLQLVIEDGGAYLDGDVITLKSFDPLRIYPATLGRASKENVCICIVIGKKDSLFLKEFYNTFPKHFSFKLLGYATTKYVTDFIKTTKFKVHVEESSMNRPNVIVKEDGILSTTLDSIDLSDNYFLHIHPRAVPKEESNIFLKNGAWLKFEDEELRTLDGAYGDAARIALFGSPDLVFKPGESVFEMKPKRKMKVFDPIVQRNAIIDDGADNFY